MKADLLRAEKEHEETVALGEDFSKDKLVLNTAETAAQLIQEKAVAKALSQACPEGKPICELSTLVELLYMQEADLIGATNAFDSSMGVVCSSPS